MMQLLLVQPLRFGRKPCQILGLGMEGEASYSTRTKRPRLRLRAGLKTAGYEAESLWKCPTVGKGKNTPKRCRRTTGLHQCFADLVA